MVYTTPHPDDAQLAAWRRRQAEDAVRSINIRLPLGLARRLRAEAAARGVSVGRYVGNLLRVALGDLPGGPPPPAAPRRATVDRRCAGHTAAAAPRRSGAGPLARPRHHPASGGA